MASNDEYQQQRSFEFMPWLYLKVMEAEAEYMKELENQYYNTTSYRDYKAENEEREREYKLKTK